MSPRVRRYAESLLVLLGSLNLLGFVTDQAWLRGVAIASVASPLPFVFSQFRGYETFAADFEVTATYADGSQQVVRITPDLYSRLGGSYNRRNTYGAAVSYGPRFDSEGEQALVNHALSYGFCKGGPLSLQLGKPDPIAVRVIVTSRTAGSHEEWQKLINCRGPADE